MARLLDEIADDIRDATRLYDEFHMEAIGHQIKMEKAQKSASEQYDLMHQYRDELLEAVNGD